MQLIAVAPAEFHKGKCTKTSKQGSMMCIRDKVAYDFSQVLNRLKVCGWLKYEYVNLYSLVEIVAE